MLRSCIKILIILATWVRKKWFNFIYLFCCCISKIIVFINILIGVIIDLIFIIRRCIMTIIFIVASYSCHLIHIFILTLNLIKILTCKMFILTFIFIFLCNHFRLIRINVSGFISIIRSRMLSMRRNRCYWLFWVIFIWYIINCMIANWTFINWLMIFTSYQILFLSIRIIVVLTFGEIC